MKTIKVVVGVLRNPQAQILIAKRQKHQFMAGFWELPGGKVKAGETQTQALGRELNEELGIQPTQLSLHQTMTHKYPDRQVNLSIYQVQTYLGNAYGVEAQEVAWVAIENLNNYLLLPTMRAFINSIILPDKYWITPAINHGCEVWMQQFRQKIQQNTQLIQLRSKSTLTDDFIQKIHQECRQNQVKLLLNTPNKTFNAPSADGWHLTTAEMQKLTLRPCGNEQLLGASTHNLQEALKAQTIGVDFVVISPVQATPTHPDATPIGWNAAKEVVDRLNIPVYFLGGMGLKDLHKTRNIGAQGIAGVRAF